MRIVGKRRNIHVFLACLLVTGAVFLFFTAFLESPSALPEDPLATTPAWTRDALIPLHPAALPEANDKTRLGERLFFDKRLSGNNTIACASCHDPERGGTDRLVEIGGLLGQARVGGVRLVQPGEGGLGGLGGGVQFRLLGAQRQLPHAPVVLEREQYQQAGDRFGNFLSLCASVYAAQTFGWLPSTALLQAPDEEKLRAVIGETGYTILSVEQAPYERKGMFSFLHK